LQKWISYDSDPEGYVAIKGDINFSGGFRVLEVIDEYKFKIVRPSPLTPSTTQVWRMQKAQSRNLLSGLYSELDSEGIPYVAGLRIDLIHSGSNTPAVTSYINQGSFLIRINGLEINSALQYENDYGSWYGVVVNLSNKYKQLGVNVWAIASDPSIPADQGSGLVKVHEDIRTLIQTYTFAAPSSIITDNDNPLYGTQEFAYKVYTGPMWLSNLRLMSGMIDIERQSIFLNQNVVRDAQNAIFIDNAKPQLKMPRFARNR
jgi:hypothetical protein